MSDAINPYAAPTAAVADVYGDSGVQPIKLFSAKGRIGRLRFLAYSFYASLLHSVAMGVVFAVFGGVALLTGGADGMAGGASGALIALSVVAYVVFFVFYILIGIQRSHDMDWSGWMLLLALIPFVALIWLFKAGSPGSNRFGAPPPPNTTAVKIGAYLVIGLSILGIVVMAVAIGMMGGSRP